jgi:hypothetical protein
LFSFGKFVSWGDAPLERHVVQGKLTAIEGSTLVLTAGQDADQEKRVLTTDEMTFRVPGVEEATI